ncbi:F-box protein CPR1-like [Argentina anserina]|uniref:F-box protein CPR1-like n=1 Tax=Argentina anserina TaxID=57926 RepID=UPI00217649D3|nr:F-box protein CPR1-like [Potentilla anserina]
MDLPEEMIVLILSWLPVKSLVRFICVSKSFHSIILQLQAARDRKTLSPRLLFPIDCPRFESIDLETPSFGDNSSVTKLNFPFEPVAGGAVELLGSCNGIVFLVFNDQIYYMWNPSTGFFRELPDTGVSFGSYNDRIIFSGVGYLPATDDYRVIVAYDGVVDFPDMCAMFSSKANAWKTFEVSDTEIDVISDQGTFINEALHWLLYEKEIMAFDSAQEEEHKVRKMLLPKDFDGHHFPEYELSAGECLLLADFDKANQYIDVWVMREYDVPDSWTKLFNLKFSYPPTGAAGWLRGLFVMGTSTLFRTSDRSENVSVKILHKGDDCGFYKVEGMGHKMIQYQESLLRIDD